MSLFELTRAIRDRLSDNIEKWTPWIDFVKNSKDADLLEVLPKCTELELIATGYYAISLNRHRFIDKWWNGSVARLSIDNLLDVLLALELFRKKKVKDNPIQMLITIFRSKMLRDIYDLILNWEVNHHMPYNPHDKRDCLTELDKAVQLRILLIDYATSFPTGITILYNVWKNFKFPNYIWTIPMIFKHGLDQNVDKNLIVHYNCYVELSHKRSVMNFLQICKYGTVKDFKIALKHFDYYGTRLQFDLPFAILSNKPVFKYLIRLLNTVKEACNTFPSIIRDKIWDYYFLNKILSNACYIKFIRNAKISEVKSVLDIYPQIGTELKHLKGHVQRDFYKKYPETIYSPYYKFIVEKQPIYPKPEELLWVEKNKPVITPKAIGIDYNRTLPDDVYPRHYFREATRGVIQGNLYLVYDAKIDGLWPERCNKYARHHPHWHGPYASLNDEIADLHKFLEYCRENNIEKKWWVKGVYPAPVGHAFFKYLEETFNHPYKMNGWILSCNRGTYFKIKPPEEWAVRLRYTEENGWTDITCFNVREVVPGFEKEGVWRCTWNSKKAKWQPQIIDPYKRTSTSFDITDVKKMCLNPWRSTELLQWYRPYFKPKIYTSKKCVEEFKKRCTINLNVYKGFDLPIGARFMNSFTADPYMVVENNMYSVTKAFWSKGLKNPLTFEKHSVYRTDQIYLTSFNQSYVPLINGARGIYLELNGCNNYIEIAKILTNNGWKEVDMECKSNVTMAKWWVP